MRDTDYEAGYAQFHERSYDYVDIENDNARIDLDEGIILADGNIKAEIIALVQERVNLWGKGEVLERGILLKITNNYERNGDMNIDPVYIANEAALPSHVLGGRLMPGKSKEELYTFYYNNYNEDQLASLYDLAKVNGIIREYEYVSEYSTSYGQQYPFDLSNYADIITKAIDDYVKEHSGPTE